MRDKMMMAYLKGRSACIHAVRSFRQEEKGASDMVAILLVIVIVVAVAAIFRTQLTNAATSVFNSLQEALGG